MGRQIILGVPGNWPTRGDVVRAIAQHSDGWIFAGKILMQSGTKDGFDLEVQEPDPKFDRAFRIAAQGKVDEQTLARVAEHRHVLYLIADGGSTEKGWAALRAGAALLRSGGLGVKVESAGVAHSAERFDQFSQSDRPFDLYRALVTLVGGPEVFYSCGMHHFGLPDVTMPSSIPRDDAAETMNIFNVYRMAESPTLKSGETFSIAPDAPYYRLKHRPCDLYPPDDTFFNEHGLWHLEPK
jgi:hypothetical protein